MKHEFRESRCSESKILLEGRKLICDSTFHISLLTLAKICKEDVHGIPLSVCQFSENRYSVRHAQVKFCQHCPHTSGDLMKIR